MNNKTLGERIKYHRKRLGLTQEELAQRMGVSAQAVSKWENNLSCPDISILPELAEVFDISLDELLGRENTQAVIHEAEPMKEEDKKDSHWNWEWHWAKSKICGILFAAFVLAYGGLLLANNMLDIDVSWWTLLWTMGLAYIGACGLCYKFSFFCLIMVMAGGFFLLDAYELFSFDLGWGVLIPAVLIIWGISLLVDLLLGKKKKVGIHINTKNDEIPSCEYACDDGWLKCEQSFGEYRVPVVTPLLRGGDVESNFGNFYLDFSGCEALASDCRVNVENNFGSLTILVPDKFKVSVTTDNSFATSTEVKGQPIENPKGILHLAVENNFGHVTVKYV